MPVLSSRLVCSFLLLSVAAAYGQESGAATSRKAPKPFKPTRESPAALIRQEVGLASVEIAYARPACKGRDLAAELALLKGPWRFGANAATKFVLDAPAEIHGTKVPAGAYALFAIPADGEWTLILNAVPEQWGSYFHAPSKDVLRFKVPTTVGAHRERLTFALDVKDDDTIVVGFAFATITLSFDVRFDVRGLEDAQVEAALAALPADDWGTRLQIAQLWIKRGERLDDAGRLLAEAGKVSKSFWISEWTGRLRHAEGRSEEGAPLLEAAAAAARGKAPAEYCDDLLKLAAVWRAKKAPK